MYLWNYDFTDTQMKELEAGQQRPENSSGASSSYIATKDVTQDSPVPVHQSKELEIYEVETKPSQ